MMVAKKKHLVCWKFKQQHQWQNEISCIASSKLKKKHRCSMFSVLSLCDYKI